MSEQIFVQINNKLIELQGAELEAFLADRAQIQAAEAARQVEQDAKAAQKTIILERLGLTEEELKIILN
jgi:hypothetical protein